MLYVYLPVVLRAGTSLLMDWFIKTKQSGFGSLLARQIIKMENYSLKSLQRTSAALIYSEFALS